MVEANPTDSAELVEQVIDVFVQQEVNADEEEKQVQEEEKDPTGLGKFDLKKSKVRIDINLQQAANADALLKKLIQWNPVWKSVIPYNKAWLRWINPLVQDDQIIEWLSTAPGNKMVNRYPGIRKLCHKDYFADLTRIARNIDPENFKFIPPSWVLPQEMANFKKYKKAHANATFIAKPSVGSGGDSIVLFKQLNELPLGMQNSVIIIQRYIDKPLLIDGFKFDMRLYVIIFGYDPIHAYLADEGLARFCTAKYQEPTQQNYRKVFMHLTNYCINKTNENYENPADEDILLDNQGSKRTLQSLYATMEEDERGIEVGEIQEGIKEVMGKIMQLYTPIIEHQVTQTTNKMQLGGRPFEILGLDVLIDQDYKPWVLEINDNPSLSIYFDDSAGMEHKRVTDDDINLTDLYVNSRVVNDTISLATKTREQLEEIMSFRSLEKVHPLNSSNEEVYSSLIAIRQIFYSLTPIKNKAQLTMQGFEKLHSRTSMASVISKFEMMKEFQRVSLNNKFIDLVDFIKLILSIFDSKVAQAMQDEAQQEARVAALTQFLQSIQQ